jgi:L-ascorbate metabolism protein UlaG (beta-lactamase superfamily)
MKHKKHPEEELSITWYGHSAFLLKAPGGKSVLIDPWLDNPKAPAGAKEISPVDLILLTHGHSDHVGNTIEVAKRTKATVLAIYEISLYLQEHGVSSAQGMNKGGTMRVDGLTVTMVDARHSSGIDVGGTVIPGGESAGFVIEFENGFRVYHAGDTSLFGDMELIARLYKPHLAILPIGGLYTMGPRDATFACKMLKADHIVGMHYGTFPVLAGTPQELRKLLPAAMKKRVMELVPGQAATI